jgi:hypothetical protein
MPTYDVTVGGVDYEVDAPDETKAWQYANYTHQQSQAASAPAAVVAPVEEVAAPAVDSAAAAAPAVDTAAAAAAPAAH